MASILTVAGGFPSSLYPSVELSRRLAAAGHRVTFAALPGARSLIEHHSLDVLPLEPSRYEQFLEADAAASTFEKLGALHLRRQRARESMAVDGFARAVRELSPELVLIDGEMHEHIIAASATDVPLALVNSFVSIWRRPGLPPPHHLVRPGTGWMGTRVGMSTLWLALRWRKRLRASAQRIRRLGCDRLSILRVLADEAGFDLRGETDESQWLMPFTYRRFPVLSLHAMEFEFPHRPPARVHYVGPMLLESRADRPTPERRRAELEAIFDQRAGSRGERKLIYAGFGTAASTGRSLLRRLIAAVAERRDWELVISLSGRIAPEELGPSHERAHVFDWVPQLEVLRNADVVVTHGGINTIDESVLCAVPMLVYCGFETDMAGNTARVLHHEMGIAGDPEQDSASTIGEHIDRLLTESRFRTNIERLRRSYLSYEENRVAERVVASLLEGAR